MGDATKEVAQSLADELEIVRALSSCGRFGIVGSAHECARAVWLKVYHALRPPLDLAAMLYVHRHHVQLLEPADAVADVLACFQASVMDADGPAIFVDDAVILAMLVKQVRLALKRPSARKPAGATWLFLPGTTGTAKPARGSPRWIRPTCGIS